MTFFDKFSKTGQDAKQKAKALADMARINAQIDEEWKNINESYAKIGKAYFENSGSDPAPYAAEPIAAVKDAMQRISEFQEQIKKIKGVENCPRCGAENAYGSSYCSSCGFRLADAKDTTPENQRICSNCGKHLPAIAVYCTGCGQKVE